MDLFATIKKLLPDGGALTPLPPGRWDPVSYTPDRAKPGRKIGKVTAHSVGLHLDRDVAWTYFQFQLDADNTTHTLWATEDVSGHQAVYMAAAPRDDAQMTPANMMPNGRIGIQPIVVGIEMKISVRILFDNGKDDRTTTEYRFDGRTWP